MNYLPPIHKACPFCGKNDALEVLPDSHDNDTPAFNSHFVYAYHVHCHHCGCNGRNNYPIGWCETEEAAIEAWNHRGSIRPEFLTEEDLEPIPFELTGAEVPDRITLNVPEKWFKDHKIVMGKQGTVLIRGIERR
jgi:hypothetical protein